MIQYHIILFLNADCKIPVNEKQSFFAQCYQVYPELAYL